VNEDICALAASVFYLSAGTRFLSRLPIPIPVTAFAKYNQFMFEYFS